MLIVSRTLRRDSVTVFNAIEDEAGNGFMWQATVIERVRVEKGRSMSLREKGIESLEKALLIIELRDCETTDNRKYASAKIWEQCGEEEKKRMWTIRGSLDFFIPGVVSGVETVTMAGVGTDFILGDVSLGKEELMNKYEVLSITDVSEEKGSGGDVIILRAAAK
jgi:hypothetical protein